MLKISVVDGEGTERCSGSGEQLAMFDLRYAPFEPGDVIVLESSEVPIELEVKFDLSLSASTVYLTEREFRFPIPFDDARDPFGIEAFGGDCHWGYARVLDARERGNFRNLALNSHDLEGVTGMYPHAVTNSGATNSRFLARNAIDGVFQSCHHGRWPYQSWGINGRDDAWLRVEFGRPVEAEQVVLFLRADFPHDAWWDRADLVCSDGYKQALVLEKTGGPQAFDIGRRRIDWVQLENLHKVDDPSPWPALSQLMVLGRL